MSFLGVVIGGLVIAMYLPIFQMGSVVCTTGCCLENAVIEAMVGPVCGGCDGFGLPISSLNVVVHRLPIMMRNELRLIANG